MFGEPSHAASLPSALAIYVDTLVCYHTNDCFLSLVVSLGHSRLDYNNTSYLSAFLPIFSDASRAVQAVLNAAVHLVFRLRRYDHVTDALVILHWLRLPERVNVKLALIAYRVLGGMTPEYLNQLVPVSDLPSRRRLRSSSTLQLLVPPYWLATVGRRSFPVAASIVWNSLSMSIQCPIITTSVNFSTTAKEFFLVH